MVRKYAVQKYAAQKYSLYGIAHILRTSRERREQLASDEVDGIEDRAFATGLSYSHRASPAESLDQASRHEP